VGAWFVIETVAVLGAESSWPSFTTSMTWCDPNVANACVGLAPVAVAPSPKFHW
jgi:hypothetical protein